MANEETKPDAGQETKPDAGQETQPETGRETKPDAEKAATPVLVLVHGAGMDHTVWLLLARYFARRGYNLVVPDLPGHGRSGGTPIDNIEGMANWLRELLEHLETEHGLAREKVILGGHSMGALVALEAAGQQPAALHQLLLFGACYPMPVGEPLLEAARADPQAAVDMITLFGHAYRSLLGHNPVAGVSLQNVARVLLGRAAPGVIHNDLAACNAYGGGEEAARNWQPGHSTVIAGDSDRMTPLRGCRALAELLDAEAFEVMAASGHMMMGEQPEDTLGAVKRALAAAG
ncbi:MAG: alpha/beta hydrolase [Gammaproteobacteria bacterium]|nr:MAG: alpha/beta hydrolase [Gammaproteobacteria bacterium]